MTEKIPNKNRIRIYSQHYEWFYKKTLDPIPDEKLVIQAKAIHFTACIQVENL
jgi:hypothetical protein